MAFTTTQTLDSLLLRGLNFRTPANTAISSQYTLYANGQGKTYWSNAINPTDLSTLSTSMGDMQTGTNSSIYSLQSTISFQSTQIYSIQIGNLSTTASLIQADLSNYNRTTVFSNVNDAAHSAINNTIAANYANSLAYTDQAISDISGVASFEAEIEVVQQSVYETYSTLSTLISWQDAATSNSLTTNYTALIDYGLTSTSTYFENKIDILTSDVARNSDLINFSTAITLQLLSTSAGLTYTIDQVVSTQGIQFSTVMIPMQSTLTSVQNRVVLLETCSTNASTVTHLWISSFVSTSQSVQDTYTYGSISTLSSAVEYYAISTTNIMRNLAGLSTYTINAIGNNASTTSTLNSTVIGLQYELKVLTTSSILAGVYDTFMQLEAYTSTIVGSTIGTFSTFEKYLYESTTTQNASISKTFFTAYTSSLYVSTLSTVVPMTIATTSSMISTLYSTSYTFLISSLNSTILELSMGFVSTTSSYTSQLLKSTGAILTSSIFGYISSPSAAMLSTYSTLNYAQLSTFAFYGTTLITTQSTMFYSTFFSNQSSFNMLYISSVNMYNTMSTQSGLFSISSSTLLGSSATQFTALNSSQTSYFNSTIASYPINLTSSIASTNASIYTYTISTSSTILGMLLISTNKAYEDFVNNLSLQATSVGVSTLYTFQNLTLTGNTFEGTMDLSLYRNFNINVYGIRDGSSNYRIGYNSNIASAMNYYRGLITINVSTSGSMYTNNNGQLRFDAYRWGLPTTVWGNVYPYLADAEYTIQYEYAILDRTIYTNLLNVYPKIEVFNATVSPYVTNVFVDGFGLPKTFWRGTPVKISWTNYSFFPFLQMGAPPFNPEVGIDIVVNNAVVAEYGPFLMYTSSAIVNAPYLLNQTSISVSTSARVYILGKRDVYTTAVFNTMIPRFDRIHMYTPNHPNAATGYMAGTELVAITDNATYPMHNATLVSAAPIPYNNNPLYSVNNLTNGILNRVGFVGASTSALTYGATSNTLSIGQFYENSLTYPDFYVNLNNYFENISTIIKFNSQFTFTFANIANSYTFTPNVISSISATSGIYRLTNSNISKTTNTFTTGASANLTYKYAPVKYISSCGVYYESTFIGPVGNAVNDYSSGIYLEYILDLDPTTSTDSISTLTFYNLINNTGNPVQANTTTNLPIRGGVQYNGIEYYSTFMTNGSEAAQVFHI